MNFNKEVRGKYSNVEFPIIIEVNNYIYSDCEVNEETGDIIKIDKIPNWEKRICKGIYKKKDYKFDSYGISSVSEQYIAECYYFYPEVYGEINYNDENVINKLMEIANSDYKPLTIDVIEFEEFRLI